MVGEAYMASNEVVHSDVAWALHARIEFMDETSTMEACSSTRRSILIAPMQKQTFL